MVFRMSVALFATRALLIATLVCGNAVEASADFTAGQRYAQQGDYTAARREYYQAALDGNPLAQNNLGNLYRFGRGGPVDFAHALYWFSKAAMQGQVNAQTSLGDMYEKGDGVGRDFLRAAYWYRRAAVAGFFIGQYSLGEMFEVGRGIPKNLVAAMAWYTIAAKARIDPRNKFYSEALGKALEARSTLERHMSTADRATAEDIAARWVVGFDLPSPSAADDWATVRPRSTTTHPPQNAARPQQKERSSTLRTGTGVVINDRGDVVTNNHVASHCSRLRFRLNGGSFLDGRLIAADPENDLAIVNFSLKDAKPAIVSAAPRENLGEDIVVFGYPLLGILSTDGNLTRGSISALSGIDNDARYMQISAPIQPGNSGGPVLNERGHLVGIVTYKLDALAAVKASGDVPQNVNFALKVAVLRLFLDSHSIPYMLAEPSSSPPAVGDIGTAIEKFTGIIVCAK